MNESRNSSRSPRPPRSDKPVPNTTKTLEYLRRSFQEAVRGLPLAQAIRWKDPTDRELEGEKHYNWQVNMAYFEHEITNSPPYIITKLVAECNSMIDGIKAYRKS